jgi:hypothetical protein
MRFFLDSTSGKDLEGDGLKFKVTNCYLELEHEMDGVYLVHYVIPRNSTSVFIATCWDRIFDELLSDEDSLETAVETWPALGQLLVNGIEDRYSDGALIKLEDFDTGEPKWFLASVCGNIDLEDIASVFSDRTAETTKVVVEKSLALFVDLNENKPSLLRAVGKGVAAGVGAVALAGIAAIFGVDLSDEY